jgi:hypothetical protein
LHCLLSVQRFPPSAKGTTQAGNCSLHTFLIVPPLALHSSEFICVVTDSAIWFGGSGAAAQLATSDTIPQIKMWREVRIRGLTVELSGAHAGV